MTEIISAALSIVVSLLTFLFKYLDTSDELKASFYKFVQEVSNNRERLAKLKESGSAQDADLDKQLEELNKKDK